MFTVILRILRDKKNALLAYVIGAAATVEMYVALFPALKDQAEQLNKLLEAYPKGLMEAFGFESTEALFSKLEPYMSTEYMSFFWPILVITLVIGFANLMCVTEVEKGTIEIVISQPISRIKLFLLRYFAGLCYLLVFVAVSIFVVIPFAAMHNISYKIDNYYTTFGMGFLFGAAIFSIAAFFSVLFSERGKAMFASTAVLLLMYVGNIVAKLKDSLKDIQYFSFFHYFDPGKVLGKNEIVQYSVPVFLGVIIVFTLLAVLWFNRRDVAV